MMNGEKKTLKARVENVNKLGKCLISLDNLNFGDLKIGNIVEIKFYRQSKSKCNQKSLFDFGDK